MADECKRCGSVGGYGCYECTPDVEIYTQADLDAAVAEALRKAAKDVQEWADCECAPSLYLIRNGILALIPDAGKALDRAIAEAVKPYRIALADAIRRPMGVVPTSADGLVTTAELDAAEQRRAAIRAQGET